MKRQEFLARLADEGRLEFVEPSKDICNSYLNKADRCLNSAKLLLDNGHFENSVSLSYYVMYNSLTALLFRTGIKCENHSGSIKILTSVFGEDGLYKTISFAKKERIDKQYYVSAGDESFTQETAESIFKQAESFIVSIKTVLSNINSEDITEKRERLKSIAGMQND